MDNNIQTRISPEQALEILNEAYGYYEPDAYVAPKHDSADQDTPFAEYYDAAA